MKRITAFMNIGVEGANPNGDMDDGNRPRTFEDGRGFISAICIKHKMRTAMLLQGKNVLAHNRKILEHDPMSVIDVIKQAMGNEDYKKVTVEDLEKFVLKNFDDVRCFGTVFAVKKRNFSIPGALTMLDFCTQEPINIIDYTITKSYSMEKADKKESNSVGSRSIVADRAFYTGTMSFDYVLCKQRGMTIEDQKNFLIEVLPNIFEGDASAARPAGSMWVEDLIIFEHSNCNVHTIREAITVHPDGRLEINKKALEGVDITNVLKDNI